MNIMIEPIVTEKATGLSEKLNQYTFRVSPSANKHQIKMLVEDMYGVKVKSVNTANFEGKKKARYTKAGLIKGSTPAFKKAVVTIAEGETINFYSNI